jgi:glutamate synthase (NADPH) small chain
MANPTGFLQYPRLEIEHRPVQERINDWHEIDRDLVDEALNRQAARCMDCGVPFCHGIGCPLQNRIPEFNDLVYRGRWREAVENLHATNNFPEITGRVCPAPCEAACTLAVRREAVNIKNIELRIIERAFAEGWIEPIRARTKTGKKIAVIGSGPAGLAAAQQLVRQGHEVVVFERSDRLGGLLRYGIPDFKLEKHILDRRLEQMHGEGVQFEMNVIVGSDISADHLRRRFHAILLCMGAGQPRELRVPGGDLPGVHLAMDYLAQQNRRVSGDSAGADIPSGVGGAGIPVCHVAGSSQGRQCLPHWNTIEARDKHVVVIGGGDTGSDCVGTAIRQRAASVTQLEILPRPPDGYNPETPWPFWPKIMRTSSSQEEGCNRRWSVLTKALQGVDGRVARLEGCEIDWVAGANGWEMKPVPGSDFTLPAELVLIAMGFVHVIHAGLVTDLGVQLDGRGNVAVDDWMTSVPGVFAAGDTVRGASLVVHAINQGRQSAAACHEWLL